MENEKYAEYINILKEKLSEYRFVHSLGVAESAAYLCEKYGGDKEKMYFAGLMHDVMKEADRDETAAFCEKYGVEMTELEKRSPKLWHAITGAAYLKYELGIEDEEIISAVRYHTTGKAGMSLNEKILFVADFISADRNYSDVDVMREKAERSLEEAMIYGLGFTVCELIENGRTVHPDTIDAYNDTVMKG